MYYIDNAHFWKKRQLFSLVVQELGEGTIIMGLSESLRKVESEIDSLHQELELFGEEYTSGVWAYLSALDLFYLDYSINYVKSESELAALTNNLVLASNYGLSWLSGVLHEGKKINKKITSTTALRFVEHSVDYLSFYAAFFNAHNEVVNLSLEGNKIVVKDNYPLCLAYRAYNYLHGIERKTIDEDSENDFKNFQTRIVEEEGRSSLNPKNVGGMFNRLHQMNESFWELPPDWELLGTKLADYRIFFETLQSIMFIQKGIYEYEFSQTRDFTAYYSKIVLVLDAIADLVAMMERYTKLGEGKISAIIDLFTYGNWKQDHPDPVLQPIIQLPNGNLIFSPLIITGSNTERNLITLINRIPEGKEMYSKFSTRKEELMREELVSNLGKKFLYWNGKLPKARKLPDLDLAIIDTDSDHVFLCELKSLHSPSSPREIIEKTQEIEKGASQIRKIANWVEESLQEFIDMTGWENISGVTRVVVSKHFVGWGYYEDTDIPIISMHHFMEIMKSFDSDKVSLILSKFDHFPVDGEDYISAEISESINGFDISHSKIDFPANR